MKATPFEKFKFTRNGVEYTVEHISDESGMAFVSSKYGIESYTIEQLNHFI